MRNLFALAAALALAACGHRAPPATPAPPGPAAANDLRSPAEFASIADRGARSRALFVEASRALTHPRCLNCHPTDDTPRHRDAMVPHDPPVVRGPDDAGVVGMECRTCHQDANLALAYVPGAPAWRLAPKELGWYGKSVATICRELRDPARHHGLTPARIATRVAHDDLIAWGWHPGHGRDPAPGTQAELGALLAAWAETGAECPEEKPR
jgi:hypothetical protein